MNPSQSPPQLTRVKYPLVSDGMKTVSDTLRAAILAYPSRYRLAKESGVQQAALSRFVNRKSTLTLETLDALAPFLGLALVAKSTKGGGK